MGKNTAFTLAEVLIVLAIIGVVAAMTIPGLMQKTQDQELKVAWKKEYSSLSNIFQLIKQENGNTLSGFNIDSVTLELDKKLNKQKSCSKGNVLSQCWHATGKSYSMGGAMSWLDYYPDLHTKSTGFVLADGTLLNIFWFYPDCNGDGASNNTRFYCGVILIDVNGFKAPNKQGKDILAAFVDKDVTFPSGTQGDVYYANSDHYCNEKSLNINQGLGCSAKYIQE